MHLLSTEQPHWGRHTALELLYTALLPGLLAYMFWELAMRRGRITIVVSASYLTPLLSTIISCLYFGLPMGYGLWLACGLVIAGAVLSSRAVQEPIPQEQPSTIPPQDPLPASPARQT